ncbi:hypothetical protein [Frigoribacterium sp. SL97]|jgi:hypothetical protein|uniref:hypothetical protein n=1 Tax=Frigoribacterium sp. SL97 TaxID=2994664 RepID=UPI002270118F|nr:hypothetical protein [Frigoribacterium sp. SL97]WAC50344.1 hypothetical protein OVA02_10615 [Frigoribacterium sp. SL97]
MTATSSPIAATAAAALLRRAIAAHNFSAADRTLVDAVTRITTSDSDVPADALEEPASTGDARYDTLLATSYAFALLQRHLTPAPWMLAAPAVDSEWLWDGDTEATTAFRDFIRDRTPKLFLDKNILLRERDLYAP